MHTLPKLLIPVFSLILLGPALTGCTRDETSAETRVDVAAAEAEGARDVAEERHDAAKDRIDEQEDVSKANESLARESSEGRREVAMTEAKAAHKIALEKCDAVSADMRSACKNKADADYDRAKALADG